MAFKFGTKAETLGLLKPLVNQGIIIDQLHFSVEEWLENKTEILFKIKNNFPSKFIVVRSSSTQEDTLNFSNAGNFESVLNVYSAKSEQIEKAINTVIKSYEEKSNIKNNKNQILVQPQIQEISMSGVIFTRCNETGSPYITINYDDMSGKTENVTSGTSGDIKTFTYFKLSDKRPSNENLSKIISVCNELEKITGNDSLDIEFAVRKGNVYILQVRPITTINGKNKELDKEIESALKKIKEFIVSQDKKFPNLYGYKSIYGYMPDWNPAEIIGVTPKPLALSLYKELITDHIWPLSRKEVGYKDTGYHPGMVSLYGRPYIDVRLSFNTFLPNTLSDTTSEKLVNYYIDKLINNPELHDKIEFEIAYTCYKFGFEKEEQILLKNNFSNLQIKEIKESLLKLTDNIINQKVANIQEQLDLNNTLLVRRNKIITTEIDEDIKISQLIHDCKHYGTLPFSKLARFAFIGNIILHSLISLDILDKRDKDSFFKSINSVASQFVEKLDLLREGKLSKEAFLEDFGHLRPGTYDLLSKTYREAFDEYFNLKGNPSKHQIELPFILSEEKKDLINRLIRKEGFTFDTETLFNFTKLAMAAREKSKFEFTKNLSLILDYCKSYMKKQGFSEEDVAFLDIHDITSFSHMSKSIRHIEDLKEKVKIRKKEYDITKSIKLPPLVYMERNVDYFHQFDNNPNFVTDKLIKGEIVLLEEREGNQELKDKIVFIKNADPGYDWVFGHNVKGLITKYGGVGSHMAIRCAEFGLPAAIGCGETIYENLKNYKFIELNCSTKQIKGVM